MIGGAAEADKGDFKAQAPRPAVTAPEAVMAPKRTMTKKASGASKAPAKPKLEQQTKSGMASGGGTSSSLAVDSLEDSPQAKATEEAKPDAQAPTVQQLHAQARTAAGRGDCATVKSLAKKIAAKDAPYYRANIAPDAALATCLN